MCTCLNPSIAIGASFFNYCSLWDTFHCSTATSSVKLGSNCNIPSFESPFLCRGFLRFHTLLLVVMIVWHCSERVKVAMHQLHASLHRPGGAADEQPASASAGGGRQWDAAPAGGQRDHQWSHPARSEGHWDSHVGDASGLVPLRKPTVVFVIIISLSYFSTNFVKYVHRYFKIIDEFLRFYWFLFFWHLLWAQQYFLNS